MADKLRFGVIGAGAAGLDHLCKLAACPRAAAVAIAETLPRRAREASERFHIPRSYSDYHELLDQPDIEAVTVAVPNHLHALVALDALKAGKHVLIETPMTIRAKDAERIVEAAKKSRRTVMVAQGFRLHRHTILARSLVDRGELGEVYHARAFWLRRAGIPKIGSWYTQKPLAGGGCLLDLGLHMLDLGLHLMKDFEAKSVCAIKHAKLGPRGVGEVDTARADPLPARTFDVEDFSAALIKLKSGRTLSLEVAWAVFLTDDRREFGVDLFGTHAGFSLFPARLLRGLVDSWETVEPNAPRTAHAEDAIHHFATCVLEGRKPLVPIEQSLQLQFILEAIYASAASGKEVQL
jgi:predicted dehydrogenase